MGTISNGHNREKRGVGVMNGVLIVPTHRLLGQ